MKDVVLKNITDKADDLARKYNKTKDPKYKEEWYRLIRSAVPVGNKTSRDSSIYLPLQVPKEQFF
jgi:hypothetical protein